MIDRAGVKERAKAVLTANYWPIVGLIALLGVIIGMGSSASSSVGGMSRVFQTASELGAPDFLYVIYSLIALFISFCSIVMIIFLSNPFVVTRTRVSLDLYDGGRVNFTDIFWCFKNRRYWKCVGTMALQTLFGSLAMLVPMMIVFIGGAVAFVVKCSSSFIMEDWEPLAVHADAALTVIPAVAVGILVSLIPFWFVLIGLSRVPYILAEDENASGMEVIKRSWRIMRGHKWEFFELCVSFVGWYAATILSLGIVGIFWAGPYMEISFAGYHRELMAKLEGEE